MSGEWAYRIPFAIQWIWPIPLIIGVYFAPESPYWCVRQRSAAEAKKALRRLTNKEVGEDELDNSIAMMEHNHNLEQKLVGGASYWDCFKGSNLRRTEIACITWIIQINNPIQGAYFYEQCGMNAAQAFDLQLAAYVIGLIGTVSTWFLQLRYGRRTLYLAGIVLMTLLYLVGGFTSLAPKGDQGANWAAASLVIILSTVYMFTIGPVCYCIVPEISSSRLRIKTTALARNCYNAIGILTGYLTPHQCEYTKFLGR
jgi:SP family general alpha glucoside:H+ symporter-like MFS transporter